MSQNLTATQASAAVQGKWVLTAHPPRRTTLDITWVRGIITKISSWSWKDPYGPERLTLVFPAVTIFDKLGEGELDFLCKGANLDLNWVGNVPTGYPNGGWRFEGYIESFSWAPEGLTVDVKGAMYQLDNWKAKPEYLARPLTYEGAIMRQFDKHGLRLQAPIKEFPAGWSTTYKPVLKAPNYLIPVGVHAGDNWTGLVTRSTGSWEEVLTSYIQSLLSSMYTQTGRWTLDLDPGRRPVLRHRNRSYQVKAGHIVVDPADPGVRLSITQDFSQSANAIYGSGKSSSGISYSGQQVTPDGSDTFYLPLAQLRQVDHSNLNAWYDESEMRRELVLQVQQGLEEDDAVNVAVAHLQHFADPGYTGTIELRTDPEFVTAVTANAKNNIEVSATETLPRMLIQAGMTILVPRIFGNPEGMLFHISEIQVSGDDQSITLTVDSKYRDALTVAEVNVRGRDSLSIQRQLIGGQYTPPVSDQIVPWNYGAGSGYIPSSPHLSSVPLFRSMPKEITFPWTQWTQAHPPSDKSYRNSYVRIGPKNANANGNWAQHPDRHAAYRAIPIKMSQAGSVRLLQIAAYDSSGALFPVPFHVSFYYAAGTTYRAMPMLRAVDNPKNGYAASQHYPFFTLAWEQYNLDGTKITSEQPTSVSSAGLIRAFGTGLVPAGYWPGSKTTGDSPTGMLVDEGQFDFDTSQDEANINFYQKAQRNPLAGYIYMMIYCDAQATQEVFFAGRMFRVEPGSQ